MKANQAFRGYSNDEGSVSIGELIAALLVAVVGLALTPIIQASTNSSKDALGATTPAGVLVGLIPLFYVILIVVGLISYVVIRSRD